MKQPGWPHDFKFGESQWEFIYLLTGCLNCILSFPTRTTKAKKKRKSVDRYVMYNPTKK